MADDDQRRPVGPNDPTRLIIRPSDASPTRVLPKAGAGNNALSTAETMLIHQSAGDDGAKSKFDPVVGWLVVTAGPGRGEFRPVRYGQNSIGRGGDQRISLDIGDEKISREAHAYLIYDEQQRKFFIKDGGKSNIVRRNGEPVLAPAELNHEDVITVGDTVLKFVAFCGPKFDWLGDDAGKA